MYNSGHQQILRHHESPRATTQYQGNDLVSTRPPQKELLMLTGIGQILDATRIMIMTIERVSIQAWEIDILRLMDNEKSMRYGGLRESAILTVSPWSAWPTRRKLLFSCQQKFIRSNSLFCRSNSFAYQNYSGLCLRLLKHEVRRALHLSLPGWNQFAHLLSPWSTSPTLKNVQNYFPSALLRHLLTNGGRAQWSSEAVPEV
jgi:hypothetical protein